MPNFEVDKGFDNDQAFEYQINGTAQDISSDKLTFSMFLSKTATTATIEKQNTAAGGGDTEIEWVTDGTNGQFTVHINPADTSSLDPGGYPYEIKWENAAGKKLIIAKGRMTIQAVQST